MKSGLFLSVATLTSHRFHGSLPHPGQLAIAQSPVSDEDIIIHTLNGLPDEYIPLKTAVRARAEPITMIELSSLLHSEEIHMAATVRPTPAPPEHTMHG